MALVQVRFFDGLSSRPHAGRVHVQGDLLWVTPQPGEAFATVTVPVEQVRWPERTRHGGRIAHLPNGASVQALDVAAWDEWAGGQGMHGSWIVRVQQNWRGVTLAFVLLVAAGAGVYTWGLPWAARGIAAAVPLAVDAAIGSRLLESLDRSLLRPSELPPADQERIRGEFGRMVEAAQPDGGPSFKIVFRNSSHGQLGPNALALPGGTMVVTDELVRLLAGNDDAVMGVLAHEYGHVRLRHAMRQLVQASAVGFAVSVAFGDYGTLITSAPVVLATLGYSRDLEREADAESVRLMQAAGISPSAMVVFFDSLERWRADLKPLGRDDDAVGLAFSSHPATAERIAFFRDAAGQ